MSHTITKSKIAKKMETPKIKEKREKVSDEVLLIWRFKKKSGDAKEMLEKYKLPKQTISEAINNGIATKRVQKLISQFYKNRKA